MNGTWPQRVLCPVDFTRSSAAALRVACRISKASGARLTILHVESWEAPAYFTESQIAQLKRQIDAFDARSERALRQFAEKESPGCQASFAVVEGSASEKIVQTGIELTADLIVMGAQGRRGWNRWLLGSAAERVLHESSIPVLTVAAHPWPAGEDRQIQRILCPVNDSEAARHALVAAAHLAAATGAELTVLHVVEPGRPKGQTTFCDWLESGDRERCRVQEMVVEGDAPEEILRVARELQADVLVIGARRRPFADGTVIGATTTRVARHSPVPVLTVPR